MDMNGDMGYDGTYMNISTTILGGITHKIGTKTGKMVCLTKNTEI